MRRRILVVDDDPGMLRAVRRVLERDYEVAGAPSADEALALSEEFKPDLAVLDIRMPDKDGFQLMDALKAQDPDIDVILMTGSADETDRKLIRAIRQKAFYFIQKPFDREVLKSLVARCLELRGLEEQNRRQFRHLERVLDAGRAFQSSLLPVPRARFGEVTILARQLSCDELCGDLYDYAATGTETVAFVVADVSGHGASAAMLTGVVKAAFRSCGGEDYEPRAVVERISAGIRTFGASSFVTLFCGRIRVAEGYLDYVNAGHPPGILWHGQEPSELLGPTGPLVSPVLDTARWLQERRDLPGGGRVLLYTDGVTEAPSATDFYGMDRLRAAVDRGRAGGEPLLEEILRDVEKFMQGRRCEDDLTLMTIGRE